MRTTAMTKNIKLILVLAIFCEVALIKAKVHHENHIRKRRSFQDTNESILNQERHLKLKLVFSTCQQFI